MLVSIAVIMYNSAEFIIELLDSIKNQIYQEIELVVSDDGSVDEGIAIVNRWTAQNRSRFQDVKIVLADCNTGLTKNVNRAAHVCKGEWIKFIAGDDILESDAIERYVQVAKSCAEDVAAIFAGVSHFSQKKGIYRIYPTWDEFELFFKNNMELFSLLVKTGNFLPAPGSFHQRAVLEKLGCFDERIPMMEDFPYWLKCLKKGYSFDFTLIKNQLVKYRFHDGSFSNNDDHINVYRRIRAQESYLIWYYLIPLAGRDIIWFVGFFLRWIACKLWQFKNCPQFVYLQLYRLSGKIIEKIKFDN